MPTAQAILVYPLRFIGDGILTVPLLRALRQHFCDSRIDLLVPRHMENLFSLCPYVSNLVVLPRSRRDLFDRVQRGGYDTAILMRRSVSDALLFWLAGVPRRIGYDEQRFPPPVGYRRSGWFLTDALAFPPVDTEIPQVKTYLNLLAPLAGNIAQADETLELWADDADMAHVEALCRSHSLHSSDQPIAMIHGASASREKALPPEKFVPAVKALAQNDFRIITLGSPGDSSFYHALFEQAGVAYTDLCGHTTLRQSYALMKRIRILVSLDSAPIHMAAAAGVPHIVGIYGATNEKQWRPYPYAGWFTPVFNRNLSCRPCVPKVCSHNRCRVDLSPVALVDALMPHLEAISQDKPLHR